MLYLRDVSEDERYDARHDEEWPDARCRACSTEWAMGEIPATLDQPAEALYPDCPACGSDDSEEL